MLRLDTEGWGLEAGGWRLEQCDAVRCGAVQCGCESTSLASFSHPSFTHFTSWFGKPPLQGVPVSGDQKQDSGEEPIFPVAAVRAAPAKRVG